MNTTLNIDYLEGVANNDFSVLEKIYAESLPEITRHIKRNSGTAEDAKDIFQEGILIIFRKMQTGKLELTTSFHVFLFSICKRLWLKKLRGRKNNLVALDQTEIAFEENWDEQFLKTKKWNLFHQKLQLLTEECQKVLQMLFNGQSGKEIALAMNYTEDYAKRKKYKCKLRLTDLIKSDSAYVHLTQL